MPRATASPARKTCLCGKYHGLPGVAIAMLVAAVLGYTGLGNQQFWDDEANTAVYARNLLELGELTAFDGRNVLGYAYGGGLGEDLGPELRVPGLPAYVAAAGMKLFGETTFGARALFVLAGVLSVGLLAVWVRRLFGRRFPCWLPSLILALSPAYLLYIRNCRYYAPGVLFTLLVWTIWAPGRRRQSEGREKLFDSRLLLRYAAGIAAILLLLTTHYLNAATVLATLPLFFIDHRYRQPRQYVLLGVIYATAAGYAAWVLATANPFATEYLAGHDWLFPAMAPQPWWTRFTRHLGWLFRDLGTHEFFPYAALAVLALPWLVRSLRRYRPYARIGWLLVGLVAGYLVVAAALTPADMARGPLAEMRYVVPLTAVGAVVGGLAVAIVGGWSRLLAVAVFLLLVATNFLHLGFLADRADGTRAWWPPTLYRYVMELSNDYTTGNEAMLAMLERLPDGTTVRTWPTYMSHPAMFYARSRCYCDQLTEHKKIRGDLRKRLPDYVYVERAKPEVVLVPVPFLREAVQRLAERFGPDAYRVTKVLPSSWNYLSKPELPIHFFTAPPDDPVRFPGIAVLVAGDSPIAHHPALQTSDKDVDGLFRLAHALLQAHDDAAAETRFREVLALKEDWAKAHFFLGVSLARQGRLDEAIRAYRRTLELEPFSAPTHVNLADTLARSGDIAGAKQNLHTALNLDPDLPTAHYNLGNLLLNEPGQLDRAIEYYRDALRLDPDYVFARVNLGGALARRGEREAAIEQLETALELLSPGDPLAVPIRQQLQRWR